MNSTFRTSAHCAAVALALTLTACGGGGSSSPTAATNPPPNPVTPGIPGTDPTTPVTPTATTLTLSAPPAQVAAGVPVALSATLNGAGAVSWTLAPGSAGSLSAASGNSVNYLPPARINAASQVTITATSGTLSQSLPLNLAPDPALAGLTLTAGTIGGHFMLDGQGADARFDLVADMAVDSDGNTYVADSRPGAPSAVRLLAKDGSVSTLTAAVNGHADGDRSRARVESVSALAACGNGKLYLLDSGAQASYVRTLARDGGIATVATLPAAYTTARRLFCDDSGTVYVATATALGKLGADGGVQTVPGLTLPGDPAVPMDYLVDRHGNIYYYTTVLYASQGNTSIYRRTPAGVVSTVIALNAKAYADGPVATAGVTAPGSLVLDADDNLLLLDNDQFAGGSGYRVRKISGGAISTIYHGGSLGNYMHQNNDLPGQLRVAADGSLLLSYQSIVNRISGGKVVALAGLHDDTEARSIDGQGGAARYYLPGGLAADSAGNVYSVDGADDPQPLPYMYSHIIVRKTTPSGAVSTLATGDNPFAARAGGVALARDGTVYVTLLGRNMKPTSQGVIYRVVAGKLQLVAGAIDSFGQDAPVSVDGAGAAARFAWPQLNGVDADGNLYATDRDATGAAAAYRKITPQGVVSTIAAIPRSVLAAPDGYLYSADPAQGVIWRTAADGSRSVAAGVAGLPAQGTVLGALPARLDRPTSIVPTGPHSFAVSAGGALLRLVLP
ncbi:NHL repeat-containing protein [Rugamonas aquatica]|uniref:Uncharacterized protein n=1 Tax=Rugamonas aquatica TaxID=2743357 RepID=A0A6A7NDF9_9BURK|nr:hypothetical protein [Rugamonas aquatica]MQA42682.1 hypothetical protein [Rugamonas aquatica]